jgi:hypothetical protein
MPRQFASGIHSDEAGDKVDALDEEFIDILTTDGLLFASSSTLSSEPARRRIGARLVGAKSFRVKSSGNGAGYIW